MVPAERPAQARVEIGDLLNSKIRSWANTITYRRSWQTSISNTRLLNMLVQQFDIAPKDAMAVAERMLNVDLVCSLGGEYELTTLPSGPRDLAIECVARFFSAGNSSRLYRSGTELVSRCERGSDAGWRPVLTPRLRRHSASAAKENPTQLQHV